MLKRLLVIAAVLLGVLSTGITPAYASYLTVGTVCFTGSHAGWSRTVCTESRVDLITDNERGRGRGPDGPGWVVPLGVRLWYWNGSWHVGAVNSDISQKYAGAFSYVTPALIEADACSFSYYTDFEFYFIWPDGVYGPIRTLTSNSWSCF